MWTFVKTSWICLKQILEACWKNNLFWNHLREKLEPKRFYFLILTAMRICKKHPGIFCLCTFERTEIAWRFNREYFHVLWNFPFNYGCGQFWEPKEYIGDESGLAFENCDEISWLPLEKPENFEKLKSACPSVFPNPRQPLWKLSLISFLKIPRMNLKYQDWIFPTH